MDSNIEEEKLTNPKEKANIFSILFLAFTFPIFIKGYKKDIQVDDLYSVMKEYKSTHLGDELELNWRREIISAQKTERKPSLKRALTVTFGVEYIFYGCVMAFTELFLKVVQPLALGGLIAYYTPGSQNKTEKPQVLGYCAVIILCAIFNLFLYNHSSLALSNLGLKMKIACCSLIYRKALKLNRSALANTTLGQMVNLLSNDVNRFDNFVVFGNYVWIGPIQMVVIGYFMYKQVKISAMAGMLFILIIIFLHLFLGKKSAIYRLKTALKTDERIRLMNEIISGIQVIKMYTWEKAFAKLVNFARQCEIAPIHKTSYVIGIHSTLNLTMSRFSLYLSVLSYVLLSDTIDAKKIYVLTTFYNVLRSSVAIFFAYGLAKVAETSVSVERLNEFLLYNEKLTSTDSIEGQRSEINVRSNIALKISNGYVKWLTESKDNALSNINLTVNRGSLIGIIGPVGSGKTTLFYTILRELSLSKGNIQVNGKISYASQEVWIFPGTVRQNILFGLPMDKFRYNLVVRKCALKKDFGLLQYGDKTIVGERGISLSGGQKARINLARAVYREADIYLLDDPLSAVDTRVGKNLFEDCICGFLKGKTVLLITHQLQYLENVKNVLILQNGHIKAEGSLNQLQMSGLDFVQLLGQQKKNIEDESELSVSYPTVSERRRSSLGSIGSLDGYSLETVNETEEDRSHGTLSKRLFHIYFTSGSPNFIAYGILLSFVVTQVLVSSVDYFLSYCINKNQQLQSKYINQLNSRYINSDNPAYYMTHKTYKLLLQKMIVYFVIVYSILMVVTVIVALCRSFAFFSMCMRSSVTLHNNMFKNICRATMRFFNANNSGRILNRFSRDIGIIDEFLPVCMIDSLQVGLNLLGIMVVIGMVNVWLLIPTLLFAFAFNSVRKIYTQTSSDVKRLEGVTRSPVFGYFSSSIQGLPTIRAFGAESILENEFDKHQDLHSSAFHLYLVTSKALTLYLDILCVAYIAMVSLSFPLFYNNALSGNVGLAITQAISLTGMLQYGIRQSTEMENQMTSIERVLEYSCVEEEPPLDSSPDKKPPPTWPTNGCIKFVNVFLRYSPNDPPVLKKLNFAIQPLEKIGIVGRTGAGKSSLIAALFRLTETEGSIIIDGINTREIGLHDLRSKISIIPQEPLLFSGSLRRNLDPFNQYPDDSLWLALEEVELKSCVLEASTGLNMPVLEGGSNFSVGQRQLICLARAILRNNKILVLDEATANVDPQTDLFIQSTIRKKFENCTVLTIAHRLHTVMDSDKVAVMDSGYLVEFDHPHVLLQNRNGYFYKMVQQTGESMAAYLKAISDKTYEEIHRSKTLLEL